MGQEGEGCGGAQNGIIELLGCNSEMELSKVAWLVFKHMSANFFKC